MKNLYSIFLLFSISFYSQNNIKENQTQESFEEKITFHIDNTYASKDMDSVKYHADLAFHYANLSDNDTLLMRSYHALAHSSKIKYDYNLAGENTIKCLNLAKKLDDKYYQFLCNNLLGIVKSNENSINYLLCIILMHSH